MDWQMRETNNSECGSSRYYEADDDTAISRDALQKRVSADARDTDSWLLLAINQLGFEMNLRYEPQCVSCCIAVYWRFTHEMVVLQLVRMRSASRIRTESWSS